MSDPPSPERDRNFASATCSGSHRAGATAREIEYRLLGQGSIDSTGFYNQVKGGDEMIDYSILLTGSRVKGS